ncbi:hypothetical protein [Achromobacter insuavis]|uniref:hypothetical protein n=1 Tax=Achromobacter insuavis TaxID=1287735 RepID=UPI001F144CD6|nr:hypothetical protein [Achromobacter insuavis]
MASMTPAEVRAADALMNAAVADYGRTRSGVVTMPLADLAPCNPSELGGLSPKDWVAQFLRKVWVVEVAKGDSELMLSLSLVDIYQFVSEAQLVEFRNSMSAMALFSGEGPAAA